jgi:AcrR family transcriptional regulator
MPYPAKTSAPQILAAAVALLEREGQIGLSLRALAAELKLTPNALYRYYPSREALLAAVAVQGAQWLLADLQAIPEGDLAALAHTYLRFAQQRPALYDLYMTCDSLSAKQRVVYDQQWALVVVALEPLAGARSSEAAITLWAYLHGLVGLERSGVYDHDGDKPRHTTEFGLGLLMAGLKNLSS